ncbi:MAG TPA: radical SAM family heme chaperone HemW [Proteobacteria bacterium]|nr:radical SAM family heme chaperone HemW [Pseudomonadota bacterium]
MNKPSAAGHVYIHLPFCHSRCSYCSFVSVAVDRVPEAEYLEALLAELDCRRRLFPELFHPLASLYFGGGTPSLFSPSFFSKIIEYLSETPGFAEDFEITLEANPADVELWRMEGYRAAGVNRVSLGVQTFDERGLKILGRRHDAESAVQAISVLRRAGFENLSFDLIYAWPEQEISQLEVDLERLVSLAPEHVSAYVLSLEPGTQMKAEVAAGRLRSLSEAVQREMMELVSRRLERGGLRRYEVSNYARERKFQAQHNLACWRMRDFIGLGAGACGNWKGRRHQDSWAEHYCNLADPFLYMEKLAAWRRAAAAGLGFRPEDRLWSAVGRESSWSETETVDREVSFSESLMMGLRLRQGVELAELKDEFGCELVADLLSRARPLELEGLLARDRHALKITDQGLFLSDSILAFLL